MRRWRAPRPWRLRVRSRVERDSAWPGSCSVQDGPGGTAPASRTHRIFAWRRRTSCITTDASASSRPNSLCAMGRYAVALRASRRRMAASPHVGTCVLAQSSIWILMSAGGLLSRSGLCFRVWIGIASPRAGRMCDWPGRGSLEFWSSRCPGGSHCSIGPMWRGLAFRSLASALANSVAGGRGSATKAQGHIDLDLRSSFHSRRLLRRARKLR